MSSLITREVEDQVRRRFAGLTGPVRLLLFTEPHACGACADQEALLRSLAALSPKVELEVHPLDSPPALEHGIDKAPATLVRGANHGTMRFFGLTGGYEFGSLLGAIEMASSGDSGLDPAVAALVRLLRAPLHLEVMVTLACPYCPRMVHLVHQLAAANPVVTADMIDSAEFPELVNRYDVHGVPLTVIDGRRGFEGALPAEQAMLEILRVAAPDEFERIDARLREAQGLRQAREAVDSALYDIAVVGAGPAGLTAALYAQRKGRSTLLVGKEAGGQVNDTASVENYPGLEKVGGADLAQAIRRHVEAYPVAEHCHAEVEKVEREGAGFVMRTGDGRTLRARSLIYCTGKRSRRLGVPGEERFIGRGVAWCATCDAPLYQGKRVAVVGGGNSALTAVRDLQRYASAVHLVHAEQQFQADQVLVDEVHRAQTQGRVRVHLGARVREILGRDHLTGLRLASAAGAPLDDLAVDGVFLEIGLEPNSAPLAGLIKLNAQGEVPVNRQQATPVPGLFAAGDVTDEEDKQIIIAAGAGAKAALAADRYLAGLDQTG